MLEKFYDAILTILKTYTLNNNQDDNEAVKKTLQNDYKILEKKILKHKQTKSGESFAIKYLDETYLFISFDDLDSNYKLYVIINKKLDNDCIIYCVKKDTKTAYANILTSYSDKISHMIITSNGIHMFKISLMLLEKYKKSLNIRKIMVTDRNFVYSEKTKHNIKLSDLFILRYGDTFYSKLGFNLVDNTVNLKNKKILEKLKVKDSELIDLLKKYNESKNVNEILKMVERNNDEYFIKLFNKISNRKNFEENEELINYLIPKLLVKLKLVSEFNQQYYYDFV